MPLVVAVVHPAPAALGSGRVDAEWVADRHRAAEAVLDGARTVLGRAPARSTYRIGGVVARPRTACTTWPRSSGAEAIVVGSGGAARQHRLFAGSTAERLLAGSVCPVAVAPAGMQTPPGALGRIGVAYVDTPDGRAALDAGGPAGPAHRQPAAAVHGGGRGRRDAAVPGRAGRRARVPGNRPGDVRAVAEPGGRRRSRASTADWEVRTGDVVETLAELDDVDVLFCGSRGYGPARRVLLGGVSARLLRRARRPVVVVPRSG